MSYFVYRAYGAGAVITLIALVGAYDAMDRAANWKTADAEVSYIDRDCKIVRTHYGEGDRPTQTETVTDACNSVDEWQTVREKRNKVVDGKAVIHLSYTAPQNGELESGTLTFDGRDDEFYQLKAGDHMRILVSNSDPSKIRKA